MKIRYTGDDESRDLAVRGGLIVCPRMKWVDIEKEAQATGIAVDHALVVARDVVSQDDWELESVVKAKRTRAKNAKNNQGGIVTSPGLVSLGNDGPEAIVPLNEVSEPPVNDEDQS